MGVVKGAITLKDNATAVLQGIRKEQSAFRQDVEKTKGTLKSTWDKQYKARIESTSASKKISELKTKMEPLRKKVVTAVAIKDMATSKVKAVGNKVKTVGKMVATPVVNVVVKGAQALSSIGKGIATAGKIAAASVGAVAAAGAAGLTALFSGSTEAAKAQIEAETKLEAVLGNVKSLQSGGAGAVKQAKQNLMGVASELQQVGVIGDEVTLAGMQQLATFQLSDKEISQLAGGMTDLLAQQKGLNATQEDAVGIGNMIGKVMQGQTSALSRVGITFDEAQEKALKTGTAEQKAAVLAEILEQNVGGVNKALAETDQGKIQQMSNAWGDMKEEVGKVMLTIKGKFASVVMKNIPTIQKLGTTLMGSISKFADYAMPVLDKVISNVAPMVEGLLSKIGSMADTMAPVLADVFNGLAEGAAAARPVLMGLISGFMPLMPQLVAFGGAVMAAVQQVATAAMPVISTIITTVQNVIPAVLPVLQTVVTTIANVISAAAPVIGGLVQGIGTVVSALAPVFSTIFSEIGEKVGSVLNFVGSKMGWIQDIISTAMPVVSSIISTAWSIISPIMDIAISVFKLLFNVVQTVFNGIVKVISSVWDKIKPILDGVANGLSWIKDKIGGLFGGGDGGGGEVGTNAAGTNNWRGGLTVVGEEGPELVDLPRGSRILPNKESVQFAGQSRGETIYNNYQQSVVQQTVAASGGAAVPVLQEINRNLILITSKLERPAEQLSIPDVAAFPVVQQRQPDEALPSPLQQNQKSGSGTVKATASSGSNSIVITIAKLADQIVVREEGDIDRIGEAVAKKVIQALKNMPRPA